MGTLEARGQHQLVDIARGDVFLRTAHKLGVPRLRQGGRRRRELSGRCQRRHRPAQRADDLAPQALPLSFAAIVQHGHAARQVIEYQQRARRDVVGVRRLRRIEAAPGQALEITHRIVSGVTDQAAEQRHAGQVRQGLRGEGERGAQRIKEFAARSGPRGALTVDMHPGGIKLHLQAVAKADERIARQALAALDALKQEAGPERRQFQVGRYRGIEISGYVKRWLHIASKKNPPPVLVGDGFWIGEILKS